MNKRLLAIVTAVALVFAMVPAFAFAAEGDISVKVTIKNNNFVTPLVNDEGKKVNPAWTGKAVDNYEVVLAENETAQTAIEKACQDNGMAYIIDTSWSPYLKNIDGLKGGMTGILTDAEGWGSFYDMSGWMFLVNGSKPGYNGIYNGIGDMVNSKTADPDKQLKDKDVITMAYSVDNTAENVDKAFEQGVELNKKKVTLAKGKSIVLKAGIKPAYGAVAKNGAVWTSSDPSVAKVDTKGKVIAASAGIATIKAAATNKLSAAAKVTINPEKTTILQAKGKKKAVLLKWKKQKDATGYIIYRAAKKKGTFKAVKTIKKNSTIKWTNKKLKKGKKYFYKIKVYKNSKGGKVQSPFSAVKGAKVK